MGLGREVSRKRTRSPTRGTRALPGIYLRLAWGKRGQLAKAFGVSRSYLISADFFPGSTACPERSRMDVPACWSLCLATPDFREQGNLGRMFRRDAETSTRDGRA